MTQSAAQWAAFAREVAKNRKVWTVRDIDGRVVAGISETHSGCYGLIVCDKGKVVRHFSDEDGKISANEGRLPDEVPSLEENSLGGVENIWKKLVPTSNVTNVEVYVFSKESLADELKQWELDRKNLSAFIKAGDEFASDHNYKDAISNYEKARTVLHAMMFEEREDSKSIDLADELSRKIDECEMKLTTTASSDGTGLLRTPKPSAIAMECSMPDACIAASKATQTREYEAARKVANLGEMAKSFSDCEQRVWATPTYWLGLARSGNNTIIFDPQRFLPSNTKLIRAMSKESKGRVVSGVVKQDFVSLIVCDNGQVVRDFRFHNGKVLTDDGHLPEEQSKLSTNSEESLKKTWAKLVPPAKMMNFEVHVFSQEPTTAYARRKSGDSNHFYEPPPEPGLNYVIPVQLTLSESLAEDIIFGDKHVRKQDYEAAYSSYYNALMDAERLQDKFPGDLKLPLLVQEVESKSRDCKARIGMK